MLRHALERLPIYIQDSATTSGEAREYLRDNPDIRLALLDDGLQHLPLVKCVRGARGGFVRARFCAAADGRGCSSVAPPCC